MFIRKWKNTCFNNTCTYYYSVDTIYYVTDNINVPTDMAFTVVGMLKNII